MVILSIRPEPPGGGNTVARFDAQLDGLRLYNLKLAKTASGYRVFGPSAFGAAAVTFTHEIATALIEAALGEMDRNERSAA